MALALFNILERQGDVQGIKEGRRKRESESPWGVGGTLMLMEMTPGMIFFLTDFYKWLLCMEIIVSPTCNNPPLFLS